MLTPFKKKIFYIEKNTVIVTIFVLKKSVTIAMRNLGFHLPSWTL